MRAGGCLGDALLNPPYFAGLPPLTAVSQRKDVNPISQAKEMETGSHPGSHKNRCEGSDLIFPSKTHSLFQSFPTNWS